MFDHDHSKIFKFSKSIYQLLTVDFHFQPKSYEFGYQVKDEYTGNNYNRKEASDGNQVRGEYRVQLPDGRTQIVTYYADWQTGFHADVRYEGTAQYPEQYNTYQEGYSNGPSSQYASPNYNNGGGAATSSVSIKDYSNGNSGYSGYNNGNGNYDSYAGNFANKPRPGYEYGAP
ncbi:Chitin bind 4 domain containing protein [Asbolus verrucosus]|uniref:Chitin bind 4 domain containing protein n=1 Tax=Asbolus verrucosus TaxID=1661398 RepID=A0A482VC13_ASBVE|nr:Chitin bind 4 domain containing protein [Asbolus verrucosus]